MAPGLQVVASQYGITSDTIEALTLSIFLLSFALGVSPSVILQVSADQTVLSATRSRTIVRNVRTDMGFTHR